MMAAENKEVMQARKQELFQEVKLLLRFQFKGIELEPEFAKADKKPVNPTLHLVTGAGE